MTSKAKRTVPIVFISSTVEDLEIFRKRARDAALAAGFQPRMCEYFPASGNPPLQECLARVSGSKSEASVDLLIAIVAHRYGWVPEDQPDGDHRSITWLECLEAHRNGAKVLAFLVDDKTEWPDRHREGYQLAIAAQAESATPQLLELVQKNIPALREFKSWLSEGRVISTFTNPDDLQSKILIALQDWLKRHSEFQVDAPGDPTQYLRTLREETAYINIRGLQVGSGRATRFPIEDLYISLKTITPQEPGKGNRPADQKESQQLENALAGSRLVVIGDPGAGKTTFLQRACQLACRAMLEADTEAIKTLGLSVAPFPILIRLSELQGHRKANKGQPGAPAIEAASDWLVHFLASQWKEEAGGLDARYFRKQLQKGPALLLLDGLDEASSERDRSSLVKWIEKVSARWENCRIVVTSRPATYKGSSVLPGFAHAYIEPLEDSAIDTFLARWCRALFPTDPTRTEKHKKELLDALRSRPDIRRMARNPVMLTALAVVHWNERRLPEQRAELYESILAWLSRSREELPHRPSPERSLGLLQSLALAMQDHDIGREVQVSRRWAAEAIAPSWRELLESERLAAAGKFLDQEEQDSGIVVRRGSDVRFWHLTFQEYLAARALAGMADRVQHQRILRRLYTPEWREVVLLLVGVLHAQGVDKVDNLVKAVLDQLGEQECLAEQARCAGILGAIVRDLTPLQYQPSDSKRLRKVVAQAMRMFTKEGANEIPIKVAIEAAEALGQMGDPRFESDKPDHWVEIRAGRFWMGAQGTDKKGKNFDSEADPDEGPVHQVYLDAFQIGRYPVTVADYQRFVLDCGYERETHWREGGFGRWSEPSSWDSQVSHPNRPVVGVSWFEAAAYAHWRGGRLPTEAQWERTTRGTHGRKYPWGNAGPTEDLVNFAGGVQAPTPVGIHPQGSTPEGVSDLAGNVEEWCQDLFAEYPSNKLSRNPTGPKKEQLNASPKTGSRRVLRGGSWLLPARYCRASYRNYGGQSGRNDRIGFRIVRRMNLAN